MKKVKEKEKELWLSRDDSDWGHYNIDVREPTIRHSGCYNDGIICLSSKKYHMLFPGQNLRKGRKKRIKRILIEVED